MSAAVRDRRRPGMRELRRELAGRISRGEILAAAAIRRKLRREANFASRSSIEQPLAPAELTPDHCMRCERVGCVCGNRPPAWLAPLQIEEAANG